MSRLILIEENWHLVAQENLIAVSVPSQVENYYPIPEWTAPVILENRILAISADSDTAQQNWKYAGQAMQVITTGLTVGGQADTVNSVKKFYLRQISLLQFPDTSFEYTLKIKIPFWIRDIQLLIWEYTGPITNTYDQILTEIKEAVTV